MTRIEMETMSAVKSAALRIAHPDKEQMRYEIAKEVFPQAIENAIMVLRSGGLAMTEDGARTLTFDTMPKYAAYLAVSYADELINALKK